MTITAAVANTGSFAGRETVQLYYSAPQGKLVKPLRELGAYGKTCELHPGESESVTLTLPIENMASWDAEHDAWLLEKGEYVFSIGNLPVGIVTLDRDVTTAKLSHSGGDADFEDWMPEVNRVIPAGLPTFAVSAAELESAGHFDRESVQGEKLTMPDLSEFTDKELAKVCVGRHEEGQAASFIGNSAARLAGGAGETASVVREKGFGTIVMADGPAGLRLVTKYIETEAGQEGLDASAFDSIIGFLPAELQHLIRMRQAQNAEKAKTTPVLYHYASAIPIGTALAQSWDPAVSETCGDIVGEEMELFGANVWLAPALNIHRSPLCGRNFEYYSEDPVISGKTAAAVTRGVQKHDKLGVKELISTKYFYITVLVFIFCFIINGIFLSSAVYFTRDVFGNADLYSLVAIISILVAVIVMAFVPKLFAKFGKRNVLLVAAIIGIVGGIIGYVGANGLNVSLVFISTALHGASLAPFVAAIFTFASDIIDYLQLKTGERYEGLVTSVSSIGSKVGTGLGAAILGWGLDIPGISLIKKG